MAYRLIEVLWRDSVSGTGWLKKADAQGWVDDDYLIRSVGYVYSEDTLALTLAQSRVDRKNGDICGLISIPKGCIISRRLLK